MDSGQAAARRLRDVLWSITQASAAAGLAWYIAHDALGHPDPFFAPITAAVCLSASNVFHAQRAMQNISGVALGISLGAAVQLLLGTEWFAIGVAVLVALCVAVLIGQGFIAKGLTFVNQAASSAILIATLSGGGDSVFQRLQEALIGGGVAVTFSLVLFPTNPLTVLRDARVGVLGALHDILSEISDPAACRAIKPGWPYSAVDRAHERVSGLIEARSNARHLVLTAPRRWGIRTTVRGADHQAAHVALLAGSVLYLAREVVAAFGADGCVPTSVSDAIGHLAAGLSLVEADPDAATAQAAAALRCAADLDSTEKVLANVVETCVADLQQVINLASWQLRRT